MDSLFYLDPHVIVKPSAILKQCYNLLTKTYFIELESVKRVAAYPISVEVLIPSMDSDMID